jgi:hypothetical protein
MLTTNVHSLRNRCGNLVRLNVILFSVEMSSYGKPEALEFALYH